MRSKEDDLAARRLSLLASVPVRPKQAARARARGEGFMDDRGVAKFPRLIPLCTGYGRGYDWDR